MQGILKKVSVSTQMCVLVCLHNKVLFVYPFSLYLEVSSPVCVFLLHPVVYQVNDQSNTIFFQLFVFQ